MREGVTVKCTERNQVAETKIGVREDHLCEAREGLGGKRSSLD